MGENGFWDNQESAKVVVAEMKTIKAMIEPVEQLLRGIDDVKAMYELAEEAGDADTMEEADRALSELETKEKQVELQSLLDANDSRVTYFFHHPVRRCGRHRMCRTGRKCFCECTSIFSSAAAGMSAR